MTPEQARAGRALLNWSLDRLSEKSGVHRNTISNFENGKYAGEAETVAALRAALEWAGVIFAIGGVKMRKFKKGDQVTFRPETRVRPPSVGPEEVGEVIEVEDVPRTGPTYMMRVQFPHYKNPAFIFKFEFELVKAVRE